LEQRVSSAVFKAVKRLISGELYGILVLVFLPYCALIQFGEKVGFNVLIKAAASGVKN